MRLYLYEPDEPALNRIRLHKEFSIIPVIIGNEMRWLETVYTIQRYSLSLGARNTDWVNVAYITKKQYKKMKDLFYLKEIICEGPITEDFLNQYEK